ncbi:N-acyl amino acid synthase FeeM domain-containing protein [Bacillus subtilis]
MYKMVQPVIVKEIKDPQKLNELFKQRYKTFVIDQKAAPAKLYKDQLMKDDFDDKAIHLGAYVDGMLLGSVSVVIKKQDQGLLFIEKCHNIQLKVGESAEVMRLIIPNNSVTNSFINKNRILKKLLQAVKRIIITHNIQEVYLQTTKSAEKIYKKIGFEQIGPYRLYKGISDEAPMMLKIHNVNKNII